MQRAVVLIMLAGCWSGAVPTETTAVAAKAAANRPAAKLDRLHGIPGEVMEYVLRMRGITVGHVQVGVGQPGVVDGHRSIIVHSRATGDGVIRMFAEYTGEMTTTLDLDRGGPLSMRKEEWIVLLDGKSDHSEYSRSWDDDGHHDLHSAAGALRGWRSQPGDRARLTVDVGRIGIEVVITDAGRTVVGPGNRPAVRYDGVAGHEAGDDEHHAHRFSVWISDDAARVPLRMRGATKWGSVSADLIDYVAPAD